MRILFRDATVVNPDAVREGCTVSITGRRFDRVEQHSKARSGPRTISFDASDWLLFPGLINIHEHLRGSWLPRAGKGPYENVYEWLVELHAKPASKFASARERERISMPHLYWLGAYKNLFSGVTTVVDHYVRLDPSLYEQLPIRIITQFGREGVVRTYHEPERFPSWGDGIIREYERSKGRHPFIIHVEEGFDAETGTELRRLERLGVLGSNSILIHGIGFDKKDIEIVASRGCHMVWCPATHEFLYGRTGDVRQWLDRGINTTLGTDSSLTGGLNLFEEMRTARRIYQKGYGEPLDSAAVLRMVTANPAKALMMEDRIGWIRPGYLADLLVLERDRRRSPQDRLLAARPEDVVLLLQGGKPRYGENRFLSLFKALDDSKGSSPIVVAGQPKRVVGRPKNLMRRVWKQIGRRYQPPFLPFQLS